MAFLADEHTSNQLRKTTDREYLYFALLLIVLLLVSGVQIGLSSRSQANSDPVDPSGVTPVSSR
jgi:hypothetical protein